MTAIQEAFCLSAIIFVIALLAVFDVVPVQVAQFAPLAVVPFVTRRRAACTASQA